MVHTGVVESRLEYASQDIVWAHLAPIVLLSFQAPGQVCAARQLGKPEVSAVVVTTMVYDAMSDENLWVGWRGNGRRNRRVGGLVGMLVGAIAGGWATVGTRHVVVSMWVAAAVKGVITGAWVVWPGKR